MHLFNNCSVLFCDLRFLYILFVAISSICYARLELLLHLNWQLYLALLRLARNKKKASPFPAPRPPPALEHLVQTLSAAHCRELFKYLVRYLQSGLLKIIHVTYKFSLINIALLSTGTEVGSICTYSPRFKVEIPPEQSTVKNTFD